MQNLDTILSTWESQFIALLDSYKPTDPSHDKNHFQRVWNLSKEIATYEAQSDLLVILAASYLHDYKSLPKNDLNKSKASQVSAEKACTLLKTLGFPTEKLEPTKHAIEAHSFSANIPAKTIEAQIVQDADRLEAMGAIGIARVFAVGGHIGSIPFHPTDPLARNRELDDQHYALDHFFKKLFTIRNTLATKGGRIIGETRAQFMRQFVNQLLDEMGIIDKVLDR